MSTRPERRHTAPIPEGFALQTLIVAVHKQATVTITCAETPWMVAEAIENEQGPWVVLHTPTHQGQRPVLLRTDAEIVSVSEQLVRVVNDPRQLGMQRTPGGIDLPPLGGGSN